MGTGTEAVSRTSGSSALHSRPELDLLLNCARAQLDVNTERRIRTLVQQDVQWDFLLRAAHRNMVAPLLYWSLNRTCAEAVPEAILGQLRHHFRTNARKNLLWMRELLKLLKLLVGLEVVAVPYKGPVLSAAAYGQLSLREFNDLDILIRGRDLAVAREVLLSAGYRPRPVAPPEEPPQEGFEPVTVFVRNDGAVSVDVHWGLTRRFLPFHLDQEDFWDRLEPTAFADTAFLSPRAEDLLLILCAHGARHMWTRLEWICDVAELIRVNRGLDWEAVVRRARRNGCQRMLFLGLLLAVDLLGAPVPEETMRSVRAEPAVRSLRRRVPEYLFPGDGGLKAGVVRRFIFRFWVRERMMDRVSNVRYLIHRSLMPNSRDRELIRLPGTLSFLYYLIRPIRLVGSYGSSPLRRLRDSQVAPWRLSKRSPRHSEQPSARGTGTDISR